MFRKAFAETSRRRSGEGMRMKFGTKSNQAGMIVCKVECIKFISCDRQIFCAVLIT